MPRCCIYAHANQATKAAGDAIKKALCVSASPGRDRQGTPIPWRGAILACDTMAGRKLLSGPMKTAMFGQEI
jgi:hypothetical protein